MLASGNVTVESVTIFRTHEWLGKPSVYFRCQGEDKVYLPDVVEKDHWYKFIGEESWQPLTRLEGSKCKRCGLYEEDYLKYDDTFDEWELCPIHFSSAPEGRYNHFKEKELNITFLCTLCYPLDSNPDDQPTGPSHNGDGTSVRAHTVYFVMLMVFGFVLLIALISVGYMKWKQKKREEQQARFMKLFEDDEDLEAELGLRDL